MMYFCTAVVLFFFTIILSSYLKAIGACSPERIYVLAFLYFLQSGTLAVSAIYEFGGTHLGIISLFFSGVLMLISRNHYWFGVEIQNEIRVSTADRKEEILGKVAKVFAWGDPWSSWLIWQDLHRLCPVCSDNLLAELALSFGNAGVCCEGEDDRPTSVSSKYERLAKIYEEEHRRRLQSNKAAPSQE